jgi:hypothetical protein
VDANGVLNAIVFRVNALGVLWEGDPLPVGKKKVPAAQEELNPLPQVVITKSPRAETVDRHGGVYDLHTYFIRTVLITAGRVDLVTGLPEHAAWRRLILGTFATKGAAQLEIDHLRDIRAQPADFLPIESIQRGYDYALVEVEVQVVETRTEG